MGPGFEHFGWRWNIMLMLTYIDVIVSSSLVGIGKLTELILPKHTQL